MTPPISCSLVSRVFSDRRAGVVVTGDKFIAGVVDTSKQTVRE